jgi:hypothetical protein
MTKHLANHQAPTNAQRLKHFWRLARDRSETAWHAVWQRQQTVETNGRLLVEYARIERGRRV